MTRSKELAAQRQAFHPCDHFSGCSCCAWGSCQFGHEQERVASITTAGARIAEVLSTQRFRFVTEYDLQAAVGEVLAEAGFDVAPECRLGPRDRPDFMVGTVAVEVKVAGRATAVAAQLARYAAHVEVSGVVLVTACHRHSVIRAMPTMGGKPTYVVVVAT